MSRIEERLAALGLAMPMPPIPVANFLPFRIHAHLVFLAGQVSEWNGTVPYVGKLGREFDLAQGQKDAQLCGLNLLACLKLACDGDLNRVRQCVRVGGFVNCEPTYEFVPMVINGASDLFAAVLGDDAFGAIASNLDFLVVAIYIPNIQKDFHDRHSPLCPVR